MIGSKVSVIGSNLKVSKVNLLVRNGTKQFYLDFIFNNDWVGLQRWALFSARSSTENIEIPVEIIDGVADVPDTILEFTEFNLSVKGIGEDFVYVTNIVSVKVDTGAFVSSEHIPPQTEWELYIKQLNSLVAQAEEYMQQSKQYSEEAIKGLKLPYMENDFLWIWDTVKLEYFNTEITIPDLLAPTITEVVNTSTEYILEIKDTNGTYRTPNLKGQDGTNGKDGLTTSVTVNGRVYEHIDGNIPLPSYPTELPTPNLLMFTGAVEAVFDGSKPIQVNIPQSTTGGTTIHNELTGREAENSHPMSAITGLTQAINVQDEKIENSENDIIEMSTEVTTLDGKVQVLNSAVSGLNEKTQQSLMSVGWDPLTGIITITAHDGTITTIDLPVEKTISTGTYDATTNEIVFVFIDGSDLRIPLQGLIPVYKGSVGEQIQILVDKNTNVISAVLKTQSVNLEHLSEDVQTQLSTMQTDISNRVVKVANMGLSEKNFTSIYETKLKGIEDGAQKNQDLSNYALKSEIPTDFIKAINIGETSVPVTNNTANMPTYEIVATFKDGSTKTIKGVGSVE